MKYTIKRYDCLMTGYYPTPSSEGNAENRLEGGPVDRRGTKLTTLGQFLRGEANAVSVAMDGTDEGRRQFPYGTAVRIPELEEQYGRQIPFVVCDCGGAFKGKGGSRIDICVDNKDVANKEIGKRRVTLIAMVKE